MTKVKLKGAFFRKSAPPPFPLPLISEDDTDDEEEEEEEEEEEDEEDDDDDGDAYEYEDLGGHFRTEGFRNFMPFGTLKTKRKRGPRGAPRYNIHKDSSAHGDNYSDSALATSSSERSDDYHNHDGGEEDEVVDSMHDSPSGSGPMAMGYAPRRGSVRPKVKPSKFREEDRLQRNYNHNHNYVSEVNSFLGKDKASKKHVFSRDYDQDDELNASLTVVRKIMKMEAAEPFNAPVDPIALGIPDYFHIVKRPMDLGTICKHLERGSKYRSSQDVYEDIQLVWTNCRIYNQKGDPILDLLARVKKNFMKYWTAAGLYTEKPSVTFRFQGRRLDASQSELGVANIKQKEILDDTRSEMAFGTVKEEDKPANSTKKCIGFTEQHAMKKKATKIPPVEVASGLHGEQEAAFNILNDDLDTFFLNRGGPSIISVYKSHKRKKIEQQGIAKEHPPQAPILKVHIREVERNAGNSVLKHTDNANKYQYKKHPDSHGMAPGKYKGSDSYMIQGKYKNYINSHMISGKFNDFDADSHGSPGKPRRVSGTGHHKAGCLCVVCSGVRRKHGHEEKFGNSADHWNTTEADAAMTPERLFLRLKTEPRSYGSKPFHGMLGAEETKDGYRTKTSIWEKRERANSTAHEEKQGALNKANSNEDFMDVAYEDDGGSDSGKADDTTLGQRKKESMAQTKGYSGIEGQLQSGKDRIQENSKGALVEDAEDVIHIEEQFADTLDAETYRDEGGVRYYRASYEMPLRKINPTILDMGHRLFGKGSLWNNGHSLSKHSIKAYSENPILSTVSMFLRGK